jgi:hypothetical protein
LATVKQASDEEQQRQHEGEFRVRLSAKMQPEDSIDEPRDTSDKPDPGSLSHGCQIGRIGAPAS